MSSPTDGSKNDGSANNNKKQDDRQDIKEENQSQKEQPEAELKRVMSDEDTNRAKEKAKARVSSKVALLDEVGRSDLSKGQGEVQELVKVKQQPIPSGNRDIDPKFAKSYNKLCFRIMEVVKPGSSNPNLILSPFAMSACIAMILLGAKEKTAEEIEKTLSIDAVDIHKTFGTLIDSFILLQHYSGHIRFYYVTKMYIQKVEDSFVCANLRAQMGRFYGATLEETDFKTNSEELVKKINAFVSGQTKEKVQNLLVQPFEPDTTAVVISVVAFKGKFLHKFDPSATKNRNFYNYGDSKKAVEVPMMSQEKMFYNYLECSLNEKCSLQVVEIPFAGSLTLLIMIPRAPDGLKDLMKAVDSTLLERIVKKMKKEYVDLLIPKFTYSFQCDIRKVAEHLGLKSVFSAKEANLSGIRPKKDVFLSHMPHKTVIEVDEEGLDGEGEEEKAPAIYKFVPKFKANHPFMFFVRDSFSDIIVCKGCIESFPVASATTAATTTTTTTTTAATTSKDNGDMTK